MITDWGIPSEHAPSRVWLNRFESYFPPVNKIKLLCILGSEQGLKHLSDQFPGIEVGVVSFELLHLLTVRVDMGRCC
jgi:hypothetical protein